MTRPDHLPRRVAAITTLVDAINARRAAQHLPPILGPDMAPLRDPQFARDLRGDHDGPASYRAAVTP